MSTNNPKNTISEDRLRKLVSMVASGELTFVRSADGEYRAILPSLYGETSLTLRDNRGTCECCGEPLTGTCGETHHGKHEPGNVDLTFIYRGLFGPKSGTPVGKEASTILRELADYLGAHAVDEQHRPCHNTADQAMDALLSSITLPEMPTEVYQEIEQDGYEVYAHQRVCPSGDPSRLMLNKINAWFKGQMTKVLAT